MLCGGQLYDFGKGFIDYNEYLITNTNQIHIRYVIKVRFGTANEIPILRPITVRPAPKTNSSPSGDNVNELLLHMYLIEQLENGYLYS
jgi:hypothetical protein